MLFLETTFFMVQSSRVGSFAWIVEDETCLDRSGIKKEIFGMRAVLITLLMCDVGAARRSQGYMRELGVECVKDVFGSWIRRKGEEDGDLRVAFIPGHPDSGTQNSLVWKSNILSSFKGVEICDTGSNMNSNFQRRHGKNIVWL